jgi:CBS domain-containing protein
LRTRRARLKAQLCKTEYRGFTSTLRGDRLGQSPREVENMHTTVRDILRLKTQPMKFVREHNSVFEAVQELVTHNVSAVLVIEGEDLVGIVTERDVAKHVVLEDRTARDTAVHEIMTRNVIYVRPDQTIEECMALMTERRIRHLPVIEGTQLIGIVSIRDLVGALVSEKEFVIEQLENYITGRI